MLKNTVISHNNNYLRYFDKIVKIFLRLAEMGRFSKKKLV